MQIPTPGDTPAAGQSYSLMCTVTGAESLNADFSYTFSQTNLGQTTVAAMSNSPTLTFDPLVLSDAGQYSCEVTVSSSFLNDPLTGTSGTLDVMIHGEDIVNACTIINMLY